MRLRTRRFLYSGAFLIFMIVAPLVILFGLGYRYDPLRHRVAIAGALYIKSYPAGATVFLDASNTGKRTPTRIFNVSPGIHRITVELDGFVPWSKNLAVESRSTTFVRDIGLFKRTTPSFVSIGGKDVKAARDADIYAFIDSNRQVRITNMTTNYSYALDTLQQVTDLYAISPDGTNIIARSNSGIFLIDSNSSSQRSIMKSADQSPYRFYFDPADAATVWSLHANRLQAHNTDDGTISSSLAADGAFIDETSFLVTRQTPTSTQLTSYDRGLHPVQIVSAQIAEQNTPVSDDELMTVLSTGHSLIAYNRKNGELTVLDATCFDLLKDRLLISSGLETAIFDLTTSQKTLLDRSTETVNAVVWHPNGSYYMQHRGNELQLVELDGRDVRNSMVLATVADPYWSVFNAKGSQLYVVTPSSNVVYSIQ